MPVIKIKECKNQKLGNGWSGINNIYIVATLTIL